MLPQDFLRRRAHLEDDIRHLRWRVHQASVQLERARALGRVSYGLGSGMAVGALLVVGMLAVLVAALVMTLSHV